MVSIGEAVKLEPLEGESDADFIKRANVALTRHTEEFACAFIKARKIPLKDVVHMKMCEGRSFDVTGKTVVDIWFEWKRGK